MARRGRSIDSPSAPGVVGSADVEAMPDALFRDPPADLDFPAETVAEAIPSHGANLNAVLYVAAGAGPHPAVLLLHGLPGNEQNIDLAQSVRRAGWNVLTLHYRGSWGTPGSFSFAHCLEDAAAAVEWLRGVGASTHHRIDSRRIVAIGHSMGGFVAAYLTAGDPSIAGACLISGVDLGQAFGMPSRDQAEEVIDDNVGFGDGLHILSGTSPHALASEAEANAASWRLDVLAAKLVHRPLLLITSDDGFADGSDALATAVGQLGGVELERVHLATDHSYSDRRIALQVKVLRWLSGNMAA
jgi:pimeloyl-ACP methyl ester carboxylesterase